ncbi:hypothetical protein [Tateyamaria sp. SN6-1]|uniref:hypothetical protein n=1 Tax=Tateyamaria sp. SN6-1 TaxID=3092148 RepID=UPI0039F4F5B8
MSAHSSLQEWMLPEPDLSTERDLYVRLSPGAALSVSARRIDFIPGGRADFGTYCNAFNTGKWFKYCGLERLFLQLRGAGRFELVVWRVQPERSWERVVNEVINLGTDSEFEVTPPGGFSHRGVMFFELTALEDGHLTDAIWQTDAAPRRTPELMLSVTTFRREAAVSRTAARFAAFAAQSPIAEHLHLTIVDNGQTADIAADPHITVLPNANLGGAGGFARGLLAAQERDATHCLFMDDDASVHMEAISRTWRFLAYATDPATAVAGAVANAQHRWQLWENGALFDRICRPLHKGTDLRDTGQTFEMEFESTATAPDNFYGGWWYFAFPVTVVEHMPFPFFVRGDDVSFSLVHDFKTVTLPGVLSFQDEDFSVKETPLTVYLDLRSHLAHHLALPKMDIGRKGIALIILRFYLRSLISAHYDTLEAVALALEDVRAGPDYFSENADMTTRRQQIGALTDAERWRETDDHQEAATRNWLSPHRWLDRVLMKCTVNGHLLPGFSLIGNRIKLPASERGAVRPIWGAATITYQSADGARSYTVRHSKKRAARVTGSILRKAWAMWREHDAIVDRWRTGYRDQTQPEAWHTKLEIENSSAPRQ